MTDKLRQQIAAALGDAWGMDNAADKAAAVDAVMAVVEQEIKHHKNRINIFKNMASSVMNSRNEAIAKRDALHQQVIKLEAHNTNITYAAKQAEAERDEAREEVARLQARVAGLEGALTSIADFQYMGGTHVSLNWKKGYLAAMETLGDIAVIALVTTDQPANVAGHDDAPAQECPACRGVGHANGVCPECGGEGELNEWERDYYRKVQDEWAQKVYESDAICPICASHGDDCDCSLRYMEFSDETPDDYDLPNGG